MSGPSTQRQKLTIRAYRGQCLICDTGLYEGDEVVRGRGQLLGPIHAGCWRRHEAKTEGK